VVGFFCVFFCFCFFFVEAGADQKATSAVKKGKRGLSPRGGKRTPQNSITLGIKKKAYDLEWRGPSRFTKEKGASPGVFKGQPCPRKRLHFGEKRPSLKGRTGGGRGRKAFYQRRGRERAISGRRSPTEGGGGPSMFVKKRRERRLSRQRCLGGKEKKSTIVDEGKKRRHGSLCPGTGNQ